MVLANYRYELTDSIIVHITCPSPDPVIKATVVAFLAFLALEHVLTGQN